MKPLNILISNDDGVFAAGIRALAKSAQKRGHKVKVVCPDQERSATGHGLTLQSPLRVEKADELFGEGIEAWHSRCSYGRHFRKCSFNGNKCC